MPLLVKGGVTPTKLTVGGLIISALAGLAYLVSPVWAGILAGVGGMCDTLDGFLARRTGQAGARGAFLDSVLDRYGESFLFFGIWGYFVQTETFAVSGTIAVFTALIGSYMVSYTRARGEGLAVVFKGGRFTREERLLALIIGSLADPLAPGLVLLFVVVVIAIGANLTALYRFTSIIKRLAPPETTSDLPPEPDVDNEKATGQD